MSGSMESWCRIGTRYDRFDRSFLSGLALPPPAADQWNCQPAAGTLMTLAAVTFPPSSTEREQRLVADIHAPLGILFTHAVQVARRVRLVGRRILPHLRTTKAFRVEARRLVVVPGRVIRVIRDIREIRVIGTLLTRALTLSLLYILKV
ncbi:hypothetical protein ACFQU7_15065 [Pseudoroseomonas wenyumeiae]